MHVNTYIGARDGDMIIFLLGCTSSSFLLLSIIGCFRHESVGYIPQTAFGSVVKFGIYDFLIGHTYANISRVSFAVQRDAAADGQREE